MPTNRIQALESIETIDDNGNNTAFELRSTLTKILEYTESSPIQSEQGLFQPFHIMTKEGSPVEDEAGNRLFYSFKGYQGGFINLSFDLQIDKVNDKNRFKFPFQTDHRNELAKRIGEIVAPRQVINFVVPAIVSISRGEVLFANSNTESQQLPLSVEISFSEENNMITIDFFDFWAFSSNELEFSKIQVNTSISFHAPNFKRDIN